MHPTWAKELRDRCNQEGVSFFFKQWGAWVPNLESGAVPVTIDGAILDAMPKIMAPGAPVKMRRVGKGAAGRTIDGRTWNEMPTTRN